MRMKERMNKEMRLEIGKRRNKALVYVEDGVD